MSERIGDKSRPLIGVLDDIEEYLEQRQDVRDGEDGVQLPNEAMSLLSRLAEARTLWARSSIEANTRPGRIPELEQTRINAEYWTTEARKINVGGAEKQICMEQAVNAWKNAAYAMADRWYGQATPAPVSATRDSIPVSDIEDEIAHIQQNADGLRRFTGQENEARCRELCAMYLREFIQSWRFQQQLDALPKVRADDGAEKA